MINNNLKNRINKLLSFKNTEYRKKFYILSRLSESNIKKNDYLFEEFKCLVRSLNESNGEFPTEKYTYEFISNLFSDSKVNSIKESCNLNYSSNLDSEIDLINEELDKVRFINKDLDKKLENSLVKSINENINLIESNGYEEEPSDLDLEEIDLEDEEDVYSTKMNTNKEISDIINRYQSIFPKKTDSLSERHRKTKFIKDKLGIFLPSVKSNPNWDAEKLKVSEKLHIIAMYRLIEEQGISNEGLRKFFMFEKIRSYLNIRQKFSSISDYLATQQVSSISSGLTHEQREDLQKKYNDLVSRIGPNVENNLDSDIVSEEEISELLYLSAGQLKEDYKYFISYLDNQYPIDGSDLNKPEYEELEPLSPEDEEAERAYQERMASIDGSGEIDPETGEPLEADEETIKKINHEKIINGKKVIDTQDLIDSSESKLNSMLTSISAARLVKSIGEKVQRLIDLQKKSSGQVNPDIFNVVKANGYNPNNPDHKLSDFIQPDDDYIPDYISSEGLTQEEIEEMEKLVLEIEADQRSYEIYNLSRRGEFTDLIYEDSIDPNAIKQHLKDLGLDNPNQAYTWADIQRASYGLYKGSAGPRQAGQKAWENQLFFNSNLKEKSNIYAAAGEKWCETIIKLDLVHDMIESFDESDIVKIPSLDDMKNPKAFKTINKEKLISNKAAIKASVEDLERKQQSGEISPEDKVKLDYRTEILKIINDIEDSSGRQKKSAFFDLIYDMISNPSKLMKYFDDNSDTSYSNILEEKINEIFEMSAGDEDEVTRRLENLANTDPQLMAQAILDSMISGNTGFRRFVSKICNDYYTKNIWSEVEDELHHAIKKYFDVNYGKGIVAPSFKDNQNLADLYKVDKPSTSLLNKIAALIMKRVGIKSAGAKGAVPDSDLSSVRQSQLQYALGESDSRGDLAKFINTKFNDGKEESEKLKGINGGQFGPDDVEKLLKDAFSPLPNSIIGSVYEEYQVLTKTRSEEIVSHINTMPQDELNVLVSFCLAESEFRDREDASEFLKLAQNILKDSKKAMSEYVKSNKKNLADKQFVEWLEDEYGF